MLKYSATKLNTFKLCPFRYYLTYVKKLPIPPLSVFVFGDTVHKSLQDFQNWAKLNPDTSIYHEKAREIVKQRFSTVSPDVMQSVGIAAPFVYEYYVEEYVNYFIEKRIYEKNYIAEKPIEIDFGNMILTGVIDLFIAPDVIIDFKTSKYVPSTSKLIEEFQTRIYALSVPHTINMMYIYLRKPMKIKSMVIGTPNEMIRREIIQYAQMIQTAKQWPKKYDACNLCPFRMQCRSLPAHEGE